MPNTFLEPCHPVTQNDAGYPNAVTSQGPRQALLEYLRKEVFLAAVPEGEVQGRSISWPATVKTTERLQSITASCRKLFDSAKVPLLHHALQASPLAHIFWEGAMSAKFSKSCAQDILLE